MEGRGLARLRLGNYGDVPAASMRSISVGVWLKRTRRTASMSPRSTFSYEWPNVKAMPAAAESALSTSGLMLKLASKILFQSGSGLVIRALFG